MTEAIVASSVLITVILVLRTVLKGRVKSVFRYSLWLIAAIRLLLPFPLTESRVSVMNFFEGVSRAEDISADISGTEEMSGTGELPIDSSPAVPAGNTDVTEVYPEEILYTPDSEPEANAIIYPDINEDIIGNEVKIHPEENAAPMTANEHKKAVTPRDIAMAVYFSGAALGGIWLVAVNISFYIRLRRRRVRAEADCPLPVYRVEGLGSPCLFGRAVYVNERTEGENLRYVLAHEYCHYRHGDMVWSLLRGVLLCAYWFDPFVWAAAFVSKRDCECACDEAAIALLGEQHRLDYGRALVSMIPGKRGVMGICSTSMSGRGKALRERLTLIAGGFKYKRAAAVAAVLLIMAVSGCTFTSAVSPTEEVGDQKALSYRDISGDFEDYEEKKEAYLRNYDNYREYYEDRAVAEVYYDESVINVGNDNSYTWVFSLWIRYRSGGAMRVPVIYFPEDNEFHKGEAAEDGTMPENLTLLPDMPYEQVLEKSWEEYVKKNYPGYMYDEKLNGEPVENVWILPVEYDSNSGSANAGFIEESENYYMGYTRAYLEDGYGGYEWDWRTGFNSANPHKKRADFTTEGYTRAVPLSEYYSRQKFRPGDVIHSFKKQVPLSDGSGVRERTVELVMTREDYPNGLPSRIYELQGSFALRVRDSEGNITGECDIGTAGVDENGNMTVIANRDYLALYFKCAKNSDRLVTFSVPGGYYDNSWHFYTAFYGITDEGEIFPYHIDSGEFDYPVYMGGDELFTGELTSNSRLYSEDGHFVNKGEQYLINKYRDRSDSCIFNILLFDETAHLIRNAFTLEGDYDEALLTEAEELIADRYSTLFLRHMGEKAGKADHSEGGDTVLEGSVDDYIYMPMGEISENNMFYALSAGAEELHPGVEDMLPFAKSGSGEYGWHYESDCCGYAGEFAADMAAVERLDDGSCYIYFISYGTDYYNVCRYAASENGDKWVLGEFERII